jgi:pyridoxal phosphate enzyme (YggS family)
LSAEQVRERLARVRDEVGPEVTIVAATKYVPVAEMPVLVEAGIEVVGENRAQDLEEKHAAHGDAFRWHFIGHLQSRKATVVSSICELVHSLDSESASRRLEVPALLQVNLAGEASKSGVLPEEIPAFLELYPGILGLSTMPPATDDSEESRPYFRKLHELALEHGLSELSMGTTQDYKVAVEEGATYIRIGSILWGDSPSERAF